MKESSEHKPDSGSENNMPDLDVLKNNLKFKKGEYEQLEFLVTTETEHKELENKHRECAEWCRLEIEKIERLHKYKLQFPSGPDYPLPPEPPPSKMNGKDKPAPAFPGIKIKKLFPDYLLHEKRSVLADRLKKEFITEKGKGIRLMIEVLLANKPPLIAIENRERTNIYNALKAFFDRNIGTYQSIFNYGFDMVSDEKDFQSIRTKLEFVLQSFAAPAINNL
jgi:hypothetical protein